MHAGVLPVVNSDLKITSISSWQLVSEKNMSLSKLYHPVPKKMPTKGDTFGLKTTQSFRWLSGRGPTGVPEHSSLAKLPIQPWLYRFSRVEFVWVTAGNAKAVEAIAKMREVWRCIGSNGEVVNLCGLYQGIWEYEEGLRMLRSLKGLLSITKIFWTMSINQRERLVLIDVCLVFVATDEWRMNCSLMERNVGYLYTLWSPCQDHVSMATVIHWPLFCNTLSQFMLHRTARSIFVSWLLILYVSCALAS